MLQLGGTLPFYISERFLELTSYINNTLITNPYAPPMLSASDVESVKEVESFKNCPYKNMLKLCFT